MGWTGLFGLAALGLGVVSAVAESPPLSINLETSWPAPPLVLEILETAYDENPNSYFRYLSLLTSHLPPSKQLTSEEIFTTSIDLINSHDILKTDSSISTFNLGLTLHTTVPRIEAAYSWYESHVDEEQVGVVGCGSWVEWKGKGFCEAEPLRRDIELSIEEGTHHEPEGKIANLPFDRSFGTNSANPAVFYLDPTSPSTASLLNYLIYHSTQYPSFNYIVRYRPPVGYRGSSVRKTGLAGYGVELALKKTDYLVVDDRATAQSSSSSSRGQIGGIRSNSSHQGPFSDILGEDPWSEFSSPLTKDELREIGLKAASLIMSSDDKLAALQHISQDFPKYSAAIARNVQIRSDIEVQVRDLLGRGPVPNAVYLNGKSLGSDIDAYSLLKAIREERNLLLKLSSLGLTPSQAFDLISDPLIGEAQTEDDPGEGFVDASDRPEDLNVITWWNDVEKDKRYQSWPKNINGYLRPLYPGQLHTIRRNTWNLVFVLDLSSVFALESIANTISSNIQRGLPIRFGIVPMVTSGQEDLSKTMAKVFFYTVKTFGRGPTRELFNSIIADTPGTPVAPGVVRLETIRNAYDKLASNSKKPCLTFDQLLETTEYDEKLEDNERYTTRLMATKEESETGHLFINGKQFPMAGQWPQYVQQELTNQLQFVQEQIAAGIEYQDTSTIFYDLPSTTIRRSKYLLPSAGENKLKVFDLIDIFQYDPSGKLKKDFIYHPDKARGAPMTIWIVGDLDSADSRSLIDDALSHLQSAQPASRLGFIHVPDPTAHAVTDIRFSTIIYQLLMESALHTLDPKQFQYFLREFDTVRSNLDRDGKILADSPQEVFEGTPLHAFSASGWSVKEAADARVFWDLVGKTIGEKLNLRSHQPHILINGRLVGPVKPDTFFVEDFDVLEVFELRKRTRPVIDLLKTMYDDIEAFDRATLAGLIGDASSIVASAYAPSNAEGIFTPTPVARNRFYDRLDTSGALSFTVGDAEQSLLHVALVVDPISEQAQKLSSLLKVLSELHGVAVKVILQPQPLVTELSLKRFYRFAFGSKLIFDVDGGEVSPEVTFLNLPDSPIFTLGMDTPPSWVVRPETSPYDLDNLLLKDVHEPIHILFTLKQLLIEGHAREASNAPPRGLQLQLTRFGLEAVSDTQVMANLGYFQFKATPGVYDLAIRPGRGTEVYELESVGAQGWDSLTVSETGTIIVLDGFQGVTILPRMTRRPGMEMENVLIETKALEQPTVVGTLLTRMKSMVGLSESKSLQPASRHAEINIFTVASGLLYERFASIMILSVLKNTKSTVKFWFIENFLSPTFLSFLPQMADEYGFQYEFVTYKWPHWLRAQTEKQRIIWAYKILFLDVLFPMDLDRVIFVDADQIVRADMKELVDLDLKGHVYGFAPMGNSRIEMEGYRFWKTGYWKDALRGRPYHISALYVVDLKRFRQLATGDRLRGQYHALSADPNSLANLDQDLPNSMQDQIPIFTLDQDWLWCQTWCSDESLATAKTIDLCQNPMTKEPKLVRARQIPEWDTYDQEIARFASRIAGEGNSGAMGASVDELAGEKPVDGETAESTTGEEGDEYGAEDQAVTDEVADVEEEEGRRIPDEL